MFGQLIAITWSVYCAACTVSWHALLIYICIERVIIGVSASTTGAVFGQALQMAMLHLPSNNGEMVALLCTLVSLYYCLCLDILSPKTETYRILIRDHLGTFKHFTKFYYLSIFCFSRFID